MSKRRSTRLSNTPKINYEEKQIELKPSITSSKKKKRDDHDLKNDKKFKKIKLKHNDKDNLLIDDEETIIDEFGSNGELNYDNESNGLIYQNTSFNDSLDTSTRYRLNDSNFIDSNDKKLEFIDESLANKLNRSVDSEGFLIQNDNNTNLDEFSNLSSDNNQNIIDVTDYNKFSDLDESTVDSNDKQNNDKINKQNNNEDDKILINNDKINDKKSNKRIKKFVKKQQSKQRKIVDSFIKISSKTGNEIDDSQATIILNENLKSNKQELNLSPKLTPIKEDKKLFIKEKDEIKTSFIDFFKSENINKPSIDNQLNEVNGNIKIVDKSKSKRGRPRKDANKTDKSISDKNISIDSTNDKSNDKINTLFIKPTMIPTKLVSKTIGTSILKPSPKSTENKEIIIDSTDDEIIEIKNNKSNENSILNLNEFKNLSSNNSSLIEFNKDNDLILLKSDDTWTIKYKPLNSDQILDNKEVSKQIKDWIDDFNSPDNKMYYDEYDESCLESCVLITGPTGCGKTSMVYAIAEELNYKVFEINCSSRRNSKFINQIKEATLSHTVTRQGNSPQKTPVKKSPVDCKQRTLFNFFQKKKPPPIQDQINEKPKILINSPIIDETSFSQETVNNLNSLSINSNSLILVDDVDIIFDEDTGFWQSLQLLIENTKRPIILTATNLIKSIRQEVKRPLCVKMNYPKKSTLKNYLENIVIKECFKNDLNNDKKINEDNQLNIPINYSNSIELSINDNHCDIRSCLNRLQFDFSSVNIVKEELNDNFIKLDNKTIVNIDNEFNNLDLKNYNNLIISDLLENDFQINSRNELDNSCFIDDNYQIKNLKDTISIEFNKLIDNNLKFHRQHNLNKNINWLNDFNQSKLEIDKYLIHLASRDNLFCDYIPYLSSIMNLEEERLKLFLEHTRRARRFLPYLDSLSIYLSDSVKQFLTNNYLIHKNSFKDS